MILLLWFFQRGNAQQQDTLTRPSGHALFAFLTAYAIGKQFKNPFLKAGNNCIGLKGPASRLGTLVNRCSSKHGLRSRGCRTC